MTSGDGKDCHRHQHNDQYTRRDIHHGPDSFRGRYIPIITTSTRIDEFYAEIDSITTFTRYVTVGPNGPVYVTDYTDGKVYAVFFTVGTTAV